MTPIFISILSLTPCIQHILLTDKLVFPLIWWGAFEICQSTNTFNFWIWQNFAIQILIPFSRSFVKILNNTGLKQRPTDLYWNLTITVKSNCPFAICLLFKQCKDFPLFPQPVSSLKSLWLEYLSKASWNSKQTNELDNLYLTPLLTPFKQLQKVCKECFLITKAILISHKPL